MSDEPWDAADIAELRSLARRATEIADGLQHSVHAYAHNVWPNMDDLAARLRRLARRASK